jgi:hypothetical protein
MVDECECLENDLNKDEEKVLRAIRGQFHMNCYLLTAILYFKGFYCV